MTRWKRWAEKHKSEDQPRNVHRALMVCPTQDKGRSPKSSRLSLKSALSPTTGSLISHNQIEPVISAANTIPSITSHTNTVTKTPAYARASLQSLRVIGSGVSCRPRRYQYFPSELGSTASLDSAPIVPKIRPASTQPVITILRSRMKDSVRR
jgi:hypothetical protein